MHIVALIVAVLFQGPSTTYAVRGRVIHPAYQKVDRVLLLGGGIKSSTVGPDGRFEFTGVRPGKHSILLSPARGTPEVSVTVTDNDVSDIEIVATKLAAVSGSMTVENSRAKPRLTLKFAAANDDADVEVKPDGTFSAQLPPGEYRIRGDELSVGFYLKSIVSGSTDLLSNPLKIVTADDVVKIQMVLGASTGVKVTGRITSPDESASGQALKIILTPNAGGESIEAAIKDGGAFEFTKVRPGAYAARVLLTADVASPPVRLVVPTKDVSGIEIRVPALVEMTGYVDVDGEGPAPKFSLMLERTESESSRIEIHVDALTDGAFKFVLPEGAYRVSAASGRDGIPPAYVLRSMTYGGANLLKEPLVVSRTAAVDLHAGFGAASPTPWAKLSGRVLGLDKTQGPFRVAIESRTTTTMETPVNPDGSFEFPIVLRNNQYTVQLLPADDAASVTRVTVADKDIGGVEIRVPRKRDASGIATIQGDAPIPGFVLSLEAPSSTMRVAIKPAADGAFKIELPADERRVRIDALPLGYQVKSLTYGETNLLKGVLNIGDDKVEELRVTFQLDESIPFGRISGQVAGLDRVEGAVRIALHDVTAMSSLDAPIALDGSFEFTKVPQGVYFVSIGGGASGILEPASVVVAGSQTTHVDLKFKQTTHREATKYEPAAGVSVSELGVSGTDSSNAMAAVMYLRTINTAQITYLNVSRGKYAGVQDMIASGLLDARMNGPMSGYNLAVISTGGGYVAAAVPLSPSANRYGYYSTPDAIIRYSTADALTPAGKNGTPVQ